MFTGFRGYFCVILYKFGLLGKEKNSVHNTRERNILLLYYNSLHLFTITFEFEYKFISNIYLIKSDEF